MVQWVLHGLQRYNKSLVYLALDSEDSHLEEHIEYEYRRLEGFQTLVALRVLDVLGCYDDSKYALLSTLPSTDDPRWKEEDPTF